MQQAATADSKSPKIGECYDSDSNEPKLFRIAISGKFSPDLNDRKFRPSNLDKKYFHLIGKGSQAKVIAAIKEDPDRTQTPVACKRYDFPSDGRSDGEFKHILRELQIAQFLQHKHIVRLYEFFYDEDQSGNLEHIWLVMERASMSLAKFFDSRIGATQPRPYSHQNLEKLFYQLLVTLNHLHTIGIIHRDFTPKNIGILMSREGFDVKLFDFGVSRFVNSEQQHTIQPRTPKAYYPPEALAGNGQYDARLDIWCAALVMLEAFGDDSNAGGTTKRFQLMTPDTKESAELVSTAPFKAIEKKHDYVFGGNGKKFDELVRPKVVHWCRASTDEETTRKNEELISLLRQMLDRDPQRRPFAWKCLEHPYVKGMASVNGRTTNAREEADEAREQLRTILKQASYNVHL